MLDPARIPTRRPGPGSLVLLAALAAVLAFGGDCGLGTGDLDGGSADDPPGVEPGGTVGAEVVDVVDGDTIEVRLDGSDSDAAVEDVRLIGVDTPETVAPGEPVGCFGPEASAFTKRTLSDREVTLRFDAELRDDYGRLLAFVSAGGESVNAELIRRGLARTLVIEPNDSEAAHLGRLEARASAEGRGLWGDC